MSENQQTLDMFKLHSDCIQVMFDLDNRIQVTLQMLKALFCFLSELNEK